MKTLKQLLNTHAIVLTKSNEGIHLRADMGAGVVGYSVATLVGTELFFNTDALTIEAKSWGYSEDSIKAAMQSIANAYLGVPNV